MINGLHSRQSTQENVRGSQNQNHPASEVPPSQSPVPPTWDAEVAAQAGRDPYQTPVPAVQRMSIRALPYRDEQTPSSLPACLFARPTDSDPHGQSLNSRRHMFESKASSICRPQRISRPTLHPERIRLAYAVPADYDANWSGRGAGPARACAHPLPETKARSMPILTPNVPSVPVSIRAPRGASRFPRPDHREVKIEMLPRGPRT